MWRYFIDIAERRNVVRTVEPEAADSGKGIAWRTHARVPKITYQDIAAWAHVNRIRLEPWEIASITLIDDLCLEQAEKSQKGEVVLASAKRATPEHMRNMFDSLMGSAKGKTKPDRQPITKTRQARKRR